MSSTSTKFEFRPPVKMTLAWSMAGLYLMGFAAFPWIMIQRQSGSLPNGLGAVMLGGLCLVPLTISAWLFFMAFSRTQLWAVDKAWPGQTQTLRRKQSIPGWARSRDIQFCRAFLVIYRNHGGQTTNKDRATIFLRISGKTAMLANDLTCTNIVELARWIGMATGIHCIDIRNRGPFVNRDEIDA